MTGVQTCALPISFSSSAGNLHVMKGDRKVISGVMRNGLYIMSGQALVNEDKAHVAEQVDKTTLWHMRMAHLSEKGLKELAKQQLLCGDAINTLQFCEECVLGKAHKTGFETGRHTTKSILEYIHSDLWGPARTQTLSGGRYYMSVIDDFSRKAWVFILKSKDEAFCKFKEWTTEIENQTGKKVKHLRTDNGLEYLSSDFNNFCKEKGIVRHRTIPGTPQQNGVAERFNRTLLERIRCMLISSGLPKTFWGEAANTGAFLLNRSPSAPLKFKTPEEIWSGRVPDYSTIRTFGCLALSHKIGRAHV